MLEEFGFGKIGEIAINEKNELNDNYLTVLIFMFKALQRDSNLMLMNVRKEHF